MDDNLAAKFETITRTILSNQTDALNTLTSKVEKDIGQVWRQMGIMYGQLSNSINILEKVKHQTEEFSEKSMTVASKTIICVFADDSENPTIMSLFWVPR